MIHRRAVLAMLAVALSSGAGRAAEAEGWKALEQGAIVLFRHAIAPGGGDPPGLRIGECATQRNLDDSGRAQAMRIGAAFRSRALPVGLVLASQWCRTMETARLAFGDIAREEPIFNSFFGDRGKEPAQTRAALALVSRWAGPGTLAVVTHQVNITALTGIFPASGEGIVVRVIDGRLTVMGRIRP
jgi:phosphohistidine phosphatase SixA